ncbi:ThuA domain-containing protein [Litorimonas sp. WD9-15]|uniref:ThuA domain-containing protein n=1 Tax=Litorimonas sp. WD9-15 TaxID=3418716 RepID=UPI003D079608
MKKIVLLCTVLLTTGCLAVQAADETSDTTNFEWPRSYDYMPEGATLVFSATKDWRHDSGIAGAAAFWSRESDENGSGIFITENTGVFTEANLEKFSVIVMNSATGDILTPDQQSAIERFVESGGGMIAQHAMGDSSLAATWPWWETQLGTEFVSHPADPQFQIADVVTLAPTHPVMDGIGAKFSHMDEWYTFTGPVAGDVVVLAGLDESTYSPVNKVYGVEDLRMGPEPEDHPIIWAKCPGQGKMIYSALGHKTDAYDNMAHQTVLRNAMAWVRTEGEAGCP